MDHIIYSHARAKDFQKEAKRRGTSIYQVIEDLLRDMAKKKGLHSMAELTADRHCLPYFHGNRSPRANPTLRGIMTGLPLEDTPEELALQYLSVVQGISYGTRHIIENMNAKGYRINQILACGGGTKSMVYLQSHADATGCSITIGKEPEAVLLGSAILGAVAAGRYSSFLRAMQEMNTPGKTVNAAKGKLAQYHEKKYKVFHQLYTTQMNLRKTMSK
jgi:ribulose kinase